MNTILNLLDKKVSVAILAMLILTGVSVGVAVKTNEVVVDLDRTIQSSIMDAKLEYPYDVIEYGLEGTTSDDEVHEIITVWDNDKWGAQIAALQVICENDPTRLQSMMSPELQVSVCRQV